MGGAVGRRTLLKGAVIGGIGWSVPALTSMPVRAGVHVGSVPPPPTCGDAGCEPYRCTFTLPPCSERDDECRCLTRHEGGCVCAHPAGGCSFCVTDADCFNGQVCVDVDVTNHCHCSNDSPTICVVPCKR